MSKKITLIIAGQPREIEVDYLSPGALEYYQAWIAHEARANYNPLAELAEKVVVLPPELQAAAVREFVSTLDFEKVPKVVLLNTAQSLRAVQMLSILLVGANLVTEDNRQAAFRLLRPFIQRQEIAVESFEEANRLLAAMGKPPIGQPAAASDATVSTATADESPQGG